MLYLAMRQVNRYRNWKSSILDTSRKNQVEELRTRAESAIGESRSRRTLEPLLRRIIDLAEERSDAALFAHRHLAELLIERHPWRAALHLRRVIAARPQDDVALALMGLCQSLMNNFRSSIAAYRDALRIAPQNPWYHHNAGHLLDVALGRPRAALSHLRAAHSLEPNEPEIGASLAHCLARLGQFDEALPLAREAVRAIPDKEDHRSLLLWLQTARQSSAGEAGVAATSSQGAAFSTASPKRPKAKSVIGTDLRLSVAMLLNEQMSERGFTERERRSAAALWEDFCKAKQLRGRKAAVYAAAVEYAYSWVHRVDGLSSGSLAQRYSVAPASVAGRFDEICKLLSLHRDDPRYSKQSVVKGR